MNCTQYTHTARRLHLAGGQFVFGREGRIQPTQLVRLLRFEELGYKCCFFITPWVLLAKKSQNSPTI